jgi:hypothetical protein
MANTAEPAALTDRRRKPVIETALRLTLELLRLRPEGTSSDQWLASIYGLAHVMSEVAVVAGGSADAAPRGAPPVGNPFFPLSRGRAKVKHGGVERVRCLGIKRKKGSTSAELPEHSVPSPTLQDLLLLEQRQGESLHSFT